MQKLLRDGYTLGKYLDAGRFHVYTQAFPNQANKTTGPLSNSDVTFRGMSATGPAPEKNPMRFTATGGAFLSAVSIAATVAAVQPAVAEQSYCPNPAHALPAKVPAHLMAAVAKAFQIDTTAVRDAAFVRCLGAKLMGCYVGANLNCFKADTRRSLPGATAWCRENPGSTGIPMSATGHDTVYEWSCKGRRAVAGKAMMTIDPRGYIADNWKELR